MTELSCHQLGAKLRLFILTVRPDASIKLKHFNNLVFGKLCGAHKVFFSAVTAETKEKHVPPTEMPNIVQTYLPKTGLKAIRKDPDFVFHPWGRLH